MFGHFVCLCSVCCSVCSPTLCNRVDTAPYRMYGTCMLLPGSCSRHGKITKQTSQPPPRREDTGLIFSPFFARSFNLTPSSLPLLQPLSHTQTPDGDEIVRFDSSGSRRQSCDNGKIIDSSFRRIEAVCFFLSEV